MSNSLFCFVVPVHDSKAAKSLGGKMLVRPAVHAAAFTQAKILVFENMRLSEEDVRCKKLDSAIEKTPKFQLSLATGPRWTRHHVVGLVAV